MAKHQPEPIRKALIAEVFWRSRSPVAAVARQFGVTKQAVHLHLRWLLQKELIVATGTGRARRYHLRPLKSLHKTYSPGDNFTEDVPWNELARDPLRDYPQEVVDVCSYGLTEMVNNAIDHSGSKQIKVSARFTANSVELQVTDYGVGIFQKIAAALNLSDPRQSLLELSKGKFTTDPARHTGEGIFFTSRAFDKFSIRSSELLFHHSTRVGDWLVEVRDRSFTGTRISMGVLVPPSRTLGAVFAEYSSGPDDHRFAKTHVPLELATFGDETLISRSSARRVLSRVDRFDEVLLDFAGIRMVGQAFADEIFRVFAREHPRVRLIAINANAQVTAMIRRAQQPPHEPDLFDPVKPTEE